MKKETIKKEKIKHEKYKNILIVVLFFIIVALMMEIIFLESKKEFIEDKYDDLEDRYEYLQSNSNNSLEEDNLDKKIITKEDALNIVLEDLKISKNDIRDLDIELEYKIKYEKTIYEISFDYNYFEYEYYLEPSNGKILDSFKSLG